MTLPRLNTPITYDTVVPSTGKSVTFRPFLAADEKALLMASESEDDLVMMKATLKLIGDCFEGVDVRELTSFDAEFLLLKLRSKSVGEVAEPAFQCKNCEHPNVYPIQLENIKITMPDVDPTIKLTDDVTLKMRWPTLAEMIVIKTGKGSDPFSMIRLFIHKIQTKDDLFVFFESSLKEQTDFIGSMTHAQIKLLDDYIRLMPELKTKVAFECETCKHKNEFEVSGIKSFFD